MRKILGFTAVAAVAAGISLTAVPAWANDKISTNTILSVDGNKSDVTLSLKDIPSAQYPQNHAAVTLTAKATWLSATGLKDVPSGNYTFYQNGENIGPSGPAKLKACVTTFRAVYNGTDKYAESDSQTVTITLVGGHCPAPTPEPTKPPEPTEEPSPSATVTATTTATTTATVTSPVPGATTVVYIQQPVEVVRVSSSGTGSPQFTG